MTPGIRTAVLWSGMGFVTILAGWIVLKSPGETSHAAPEVQTKTGETETARVIEGKSARDADIGKPDSLLGRKPLLQSLRESAKTDFDGTLTRAWEIEDPDLRKAALTELAELATKTQWFDLARSIEINGTNNDANALNSTVRLKLMKAGVPEFVTLLEELETNNLLILMLQRSAAQEIVRLAPTPEAALLETNRIANDSVGYPVAGEVIRMITAEHPLAAVSFASANPEVIEHNPSNLSSLLKRAAQKHPEAALGLLTQFGSSEHISGYVRDFSKALSNHEEKIIMDLVNSIEDEALQKKVRDEVARNLRTRGRDDVASRVYSQVS